MLIRTTGQPEAEDHVISISHGRATAVRLRTKADGVGFGVSEARASAGGTSDLWCKNHWGSSHELDPDDFNLVGPSDPHPLAALSDRHIISVFAPPLTGTEIHDADAAYPLTGPVPAGPAT